MRDFRDAKLMAQTLREALSAKNISISHSECLELIAKEFGLADWNTFSAKLRTGRNQNSPVVLKPIGIDIPIQPLKRGMKLPFVPLRDIVIFPQMTCPLFMGRERSMRAAERAAEGDRRLMLVTQKNPLDESPEFPDLHRMGVVAVLLQCMKGPDGHFHSLVQGEQRAALFRMTGKAGYCEAEIAPVPKDRLEGKAQGLARAVADEFHAYVTRSEGFRPWQPLPSTEYPGRLADAMAPSLAIGIADRQELLETVSVAERLEKIRAILMRDAAPA